MTSSDRHLDPSPRSVETSLVAHYLRTDTASGAGPLTYLDASPSSLREALDTDTDSAAMEALLKGCGGPEQVADVFENGWRLSWPDRETPGYFRFLVLSCAVVAQADSDSQSQDFGHNLQRLYGTPRNFGRRNSLPNLWSSLVNWCTSERARGAPIRALCLPARGVGAHLGLTNAISFPGWRDLRQLRGWFERHPAQAEGIRAPTDVAVRLCPAIGHNPDEFNPQISAAADEFHRLYMSQASLLRLHRLWTAVCRALQRARPRTAVLGDSLRIELCLSPDPQDTILRITHLSASDSAEGLSTGAMAREYSLEGIVLHLQQAGEVSRALKDWSERFVAGAVPFVQERFGVWLASAASPVDDSQWLYLLKQTRLASLKFASARDRRALAGGWTLIGPVGGIDARHLHRVLSLSAWNPQGGQPDPVLVEQGVRTRRGWLGRPSVLPVLHREGTGALQLHPVEDSARNVDLRPLGYERFAIRSAMALQGRYRLRLEEGAALGLLLAVETELTFVADAPEHTDLVALSDRWRTSNECIDGAWTEGRIGSVIDATEPAHVAPNPELSARFDDFLETVYARGRAGWSESDLVQVVRELLPGPSPWDVLRSLEEARWLVRTESVAYKGIRWWLVSPELVDASVGTAPCSILQGSTPSVIRTRLVRTVETLGGKVTFLDGVGPYSTPTPVVEGVAFERLGREIGWPVVAPKVGRALPALALWPESVTSPTQHRRRSAWDWQQGRFTVEAFASQPSVELIRWVRDEADRADVYTVRSKTGRPMATTSRTVALAEAHRRSGLPLFELRESSLVRKPWEGHLPMNLARACVLGSLRRPGVVKGPYGWGYAYAVDAAALSLVRRCMGSGFVSGVALGRQDRSAHTRTSDLIALARHRGVPFRFTQHR